MNANSAAGPAAGVAPNPALSNLPLLFVGSGDWGTQTGAITLYRFDANDGALTQESRVEAGGLLSFLATDSRRRFIYAADEEQKLLRSFAFDVDTAKLTPLGTRSTETGPVYVRVTRDDAHILAAEFNGGKAEVFPLDAHGGIGALSSAVPSGAESHSVYLSNDERFAFVPGRGSDRISTFTFDKSSGTLTAHSATPEVKGAGCRHMAFDSENLHAYLVNEFSNTVSVFDYQADSGALKPIQSITTLPDGFTGKSSAADVHIHPSGAFLYVTNRPAESDGLVSAYRIEPNGKLTLIEHDSTEGRVPRNFAISADGTRLVVGNQESRSISTFAVDTDTGALNLLSEVAVDVKPFFVAFL